MNWKRNDKILYKKTKTKTRGSGQKSKVHWKHEREKLKREMTAFL